MFSELMNLSGLSGILDIVQTGESPESALDTVGTKESTREMALRALESSMSHEQLLRYLGAELSGIDLPNDTLFQTWKKYKVEDCARSDQATMKELFPIPTLEEAGRKRKPRPGAGYFISTCDQTYAEKKKAQEQKEQKERKKQIRAEKRKAKKAQ